MALPVVGQTTCSHLKSISIFGVLLKAEGLHCLQPCGMMCMGGVSWTVAAVPQVTNSWWVVAVEDINNPADVSEQWGGKKMTSADLWNMSCAWVYFRQSKTSWLRFCQMESVCEVYSSHQNPLHMNRGAKGLIYFNCLKGPRANHGTWWL